MGLRNRLLFYFAALVVVTLTAFGLSAYQVAGDDIRKNDKSLLESLARMEAQKAEEEYQQDRSVDHLIAGFGSQKSGNHYRLLVNKEGRAINFESHESDLNNVVSGTSLRELVEAKETSGNYVRNNQMFIWAKSRLSGTDYTVVHVYSPDRNADVYFSKLSSRLIVVAIIIFWAAVWVALIISTVINRKIKEQQTKIEYQATHDVLTGLKNRYYLTSKLDTLVSSHGAASISVFFLCINRFREINDALGHDFGDLLLKQFGNRLQAEFWDNDTIARFGSNQYALLLPLADQTHWKIVTEKIRNILINPFVIQDIHVITDVSIGISIHPEHGNTAAKMLRCAEVAMHSAKRTGSFFEYYDPGKDSNSLDRLQLISELNYAIGKGELELHFQPKIDIEKHELVSCEALLRWNNGTRGRVPPDIFIPLAEQGSIIKGLTEWAIEQSVMHCSAWHRTGKAISVSVNLSARLLIEDEILAIVTRALKRHGLGAEYLILEITETAITMDPVRARRTMEQLHSIGVKLSIDDFGTGYTSISQIKNLPVSEIKIDKSFVLNMLKDKSDAMLVKLIIDMAHGMGHIAVAEGIESQDVLDEVKSLGCDIAQGYFLGRPMPASDFNDYRLD